MVHVLAVRDQMVGVVLGLVCVVVVYTYRGRMDWYVSVHHSVSSSKAWHRRGDRLPVDVVSHFLGFFCHHVMSMSRRVFFGVVSLVTRYIAPVRRSRSSDTRGSFVVRPFHGPEWYNLGSGRCGPSSVGLGMSSATSRVRIGECLDPRMDV